MSDTRYFIRRCTGTGTPQVLDVPAYLDKSHITVFVAGVASTSWSWLTSSTISITAPSGASVVIQRRTSPDERLTDYQSGVTLTEASLDLDSLQAFYLAQEAIDIYADVAGFADTPLEDAISAALSANAAANTATAAAVSFAGPNGASSVGYTAGEVGAIARNVGLELSDMRLNVKRFGAVGDGTTDDTAAFTAAITAARSSAFKPTIYLPPGRYVVNAIALDSARGLSFEGDAATDPVSTYSKTWIYWKTGSTAAALLTLKSCAYMTFRRINFSTNGNAGKDQLVLFQCNGLSTGGSRNKFASTLIAFEDCSFVVPNSQSCNIATIFQKSTLGVIYRRCVIYGENAIKLGQDTDSDPLTAEATIPNGRAVVTLLDSCSFRGNIVRERVLGVSLRSCYFAENSVPFGSDYRISCLTLSGLQEVRREEILSCTCDTANVTRNLSVWYDGPRSTITPTPASLYAVNNQISGAGCGFDLYSGTAFIHNNEFLAEAFPGVPNVRAIRINDGVDSFDIGSNLYKMLALNTGSVIATGVEDVRTTLEDRKYLMARSRASDVAIATGGVYQQIMARTLDYVEGGLAEISYMVTITSTVDATFTARLLLDGVLISESPVRYTTGTAASKTFTLVLPPRLVRLAASSWAAPRVLELQVAQNNGVAAATVRGDSYALGTTHVLVKAVT